MKKILLWLFILTIASCSSSKFSVKRLQDDKYPASANSFWYQLPLTTLKITVEQTETVFVPGPYADYAERFLGITSVQKEGYRQFELSNLTIEPKMQADPALTFIVSGSCKSPALNQFFALTNQGLVFDPSKAALTEPILNNPSSTSLQAPLFTEFSVEDFQGEVTQTEYKTVQRDTLFVKIPVEKKFVVAKTKEDKAKEAAQHITKMRKRLSKLVTWQYPHAQPREDALKVSVEEIKRIEEEYLTLFIGKKAERKTTRVFYFTPGFSDRDNSVELFRFSKLTGISQESATQSTPVFLKLKATNALEKTTTQLNIDTSKPLVNGFYGRIAENTEVSMVLDSRVLAMYRLPIAQFGIIAPVSVPAK